MKILIVEDEPGIYSFLKEGLEDEGYETEVATDGLSALDIFWGWRPHLVLLDRMLPLMNGIDVCAHIREKDTEVPIIFLTAKDTVHDTIEGLRKGANDYVKKPFSFEELLERIKIHLRNSKDDEILTLGDIKINLTSYRVKKNEVEIKLTSREFDLLVYLVRRKGTACTRDEIIQNVWGVNFRYDTGVIDVFMNALRKKLGMKAEGYIKTIRSVGFIAND